MATVEEVVDKFSGMITPKQAHDLIASGNFSRHEQIKGTTDVQALQQFIDANKGRPQQLYTVNVHDRVYRIFNAVSKRRIIVLGSEGNTAKLNLTGKLSDLLDSAPIERGNTITVKNAVLGMPNGELGVDRDTTLSKATEGMLASCVCDYTLLSDGMRNIDIAGKIVEIGQVRHVNRLGNSGHVPVVDCVITDNKSIARLSLWESSALIAAEMRINDTVKIEFCNVRINDSKIEIYANSLSRIFSNVLFASKLR